MGWVANYTQYAFIAKTVLFIIVPHSVENFYTFKNVYLLMDYYAML